MPPADVAADLVGKQGFESHLAELTRKKDDLQKRVDINKQWTVCVDLPDCATLPYRFAT